MQWNLKTGAGFALAMALAGCLPELEGVQCTDEQNCTGGQVCNQGICSTPQGRLDAGPSLDGGGAGGEGGQGGAGGAGAQGGAGAAGGEGGAGAAGGEGGAGAAGGEGGAGAAGGEGGAGAQGGEGGAGAQGGEGGGGEGGAGAEGGGGEGGAGGAGGSPCVMAAETCNGIDDDCDDSTDEDFGVGEACIFGRGICATAGLFACGDGIAECVLTTLPVMPELETCNGLDDDCDGRTDELQDDQPLREVCYTGPNGTQGVAACRAGEWTCLNGRFGACTGQVLPAREICDGLDNDCDGAVDDLADSCACILGMERQCYGGPPNTVNQGVCRSGTQNCVADGPSWGTCNGQVVPTAEECNGLDDNCNGRIDEDLPLCCVPGTRRQCGAPQLGPCTDGEQVCNNDRSWGPCENAVVAAPEGCDRLDNDCDGVVDEAENGQCVCDGGPESCELECNPGFFDRGPTTTCEPICEGGASTNRLAGVLRAQRLGARVARGPKLVTGDDPADIVFAAAPLGGPDTLFPNAAVRLDGGTGQVVDLAVPRATIVAQFIPNDGVQPVFDTLPVAYSEVSILPLGGDWYVAAVLTVGGVVNGRRLVLWRIQPGANEYLVSTVVSSAGVFISPHHPELLAPPQRIAGDAPWVAVLDTIIPNRENPGVSTRALRFVVPLPGGLFGLWGSDPDVNYDIGPLVAAPAGAQAVIAGRAGAGQVLRLVHLSPEVAGLPPSISAQSVTAPAPPPGATWAIDQRPSIIPGFTGRGLESNVAPAVAATVTPPGLDCCELAWVNGSGPPGGPYTLDLVGRTVPTAAVEGQRSVAWRSGSRALVAFPHPDADLSTCSVHLPDASQSFLTGTGPTVTPIPFAPDCADVVAAGADPDGTQGWFAYLTEAGENLRITQVTCP